MSAQSSAAAASSKVACYSFAVQLLLPQEQRKQPTCAQCRTHGHPYCFEHSEHPLRLHNIITCCAQEQCKKLREEREGAMKDLAVLRCDLEAGRAERDRLLAELKEVKDELDK